MSAGSSPNEDWSQQVDASDIDLLRSLPFRRLERIPPPKQSGLPIGHELRILGRFLTGGSSSLDPSAFTSAYLSMYDAQERLLFQSLVLREALTRTQWGEVLGAMAPNWIERGLLVEESHRLRCRFAIVPVAGIIIAVDPQESNYSGKVHIGQDSLNLLQFITQQFPDSGGRILDVGTGSGILLIGQSASAEEAVGLDINPRAVRVARFNVALNQRKKCLVDETDILDANQDIGRFDFVMWNVPFIFFPQAEQEENLDGFGGHLGIGITLRFVERLPQLLRDDALAVMLTAAPVLKSGENRLETELRARSKDTGLDMVAHTLQAFWIPSLRTFQDGHGVDRFESVILELRRGTGKVDYGTISPLQQVSDAARGLLYRLGCGD
jgi:methylase of polypeptide subunit release factors